MTSCLKPANIRLGEKKFKKRVEFFSRHLMVYCDRNISGRQLLYRRLAQYMDNLRRGGSSLCCCMVHMALCYGWKKTEIIMKAAGTSGGFHDLRFFILTCSRNTGSGKSGARGRQGGTPAATPARLLRYSVDFCSVSRRLFFPEARASFSPQACCRE